MLAMDDCGNIEHILCFCLNIIVIIIDPWKQNASYESLEFNISCIEYGLTILHGTFPVNSMPEICCCKPWCIVYTTYSRMANCKDCTLYSDE